MSPRPDAVDLLKADHQDVKALFAAFRSLCERDASDREKSAIAEEICLSLTIHAQVEEEIFYPAVRDAIREDGLMDEAQVEHALAAHLIAQIATMRPGDALFDASVNVLGETVDHHVNEEQGEIFPEARKSGVDLLALGARIQSRKDELLAEHKGIVGRALRGGKAGDLVRRHVSVRAAHGRPMQSRA